MALTGKPSWQSDLEGALCLRWHVLGYHCCNHNPFSYGRMNRNLTRNSESRRAQAPVLTSDSSPYLLYPSYEPIAWQSRAWQLIMISLGERASRRRLRLAFTSSRKRLVHTDWRESRSIPRTENSLLDWLLEFTVQSRKDAGNIRRN